MSYFDSIESRDEFVSSVRKLFWDNQLGNFIDLHAFHLSLIDLCNTDSYRLSWTVSPSIDGDFEVVYHFHHFDRVKCFDVVGYFLTECYSSGDSRVKSFKLYDHCPCYVPRKKTKN